MVLAIAGLGGGLARVVTSLYAVAIGSTAAELGLLAASQSLALVAMSLPSGAFVRRHGAAAVFVAGSVVGGLVAAAVPLVAHPWFLVACVTAMGLCMPLRIVPMNVATMRRIGVAGDARAGWYRAISLVGMFVAGPSLAVPAVAAAGFPGTWWIVGAVFALPSCGARVALGGRNESPTGSGGGATWLAGRDPEALRLAATEFVAQGTSIFFSVFAIPLAIRRIGLGAPAAAGLLTAQAAAFVGALLALGGIASRWERGRHAIAAHGTAMAGLLLLGLARGAVGLYGGSVLLGAGLGLVQMDNLVRAARVGERAGRGAASGLQTLAGSAGGLAAGLLGGALDAQAVFLLLVPAYGWLASRPPTALVSSPADGARAGSGTEPSRSPASSCARGGCAG